MGLTLTLRDKQSLFTELIADLIIEANTMGYTLTFGEAYRSPEEAARLAKAGKGIKNSLHTQRLAIDFNLFRNDKYLTKTSDYLELGEWWEHQSTEDYTCAWGGRFGDGNHFSLKHGGRQ